MKQIKRLSKPIYNLMIKKGLNEFTIAQARDALVKETECFKDMNEVDEYVFRQVSDLVTKGYLEEKGIGQHKRYTKTGLCSHVTFLEEPEAIKTAKTLKSESCRYTELLNLENKRNQYLEKLSVSVAEEEEYRALIQSFPETKELLHPMVSNANRRSATMLGKVNALTTALEVLRSTRNTICE
ncbi:hypothetical protein [Vibrio alginolyticus]|uniref:hypothetical protein n=1 Tax=Vibrio alginolyticus TaxID=663 RepID=UPI00384C4707